MGGIRSSSRDDVQLSSLVNGRHLGDEVVFLCRILLLNAESVYPQILQPKPLRDFDRVHDNLWPVLRVSGMWSPYVAQGNIFRADGGIHDMRQLGLAVDYLEPTNLVGI